MVDPFSHTANAKQLDAAPLSQASAVALMKSNDLSSDRLSWDTMATQTQASPHGAFSSQPQNDLDDLIDLSDDPSPTVSRPSGLVDFMAPPVDFMTPSLLDMQELDSGMQAVNLQQSRGKEAAVVEERRDSALTNNKRVSEIPSIVEPEEKIHTPPVPSEKKTHVPSEEKIYVPLEEKIYGPSEEKIHVPPEEKIVVQQEEPEEKICTSAEEFTSPSRPTRRNRHSRASSPGGSRASYASSLSADLSPLSPEAHSPLGSEWYFPSVHQHSGALSHVPLADNHLEEQLLDRMESSLSAPNPAVQFEWVEDALRHCYICRTHEERISKCQRARERVPDGENTLFITASQFVERMVAAGDGRAYFLKARYLEKSDATRGANYLLACSKGYHRAQYYLGQIHELEKSAHSQEEAVRKYTLGAKEKDSASLFVSILFQS